MSAKILLVNIHHVCSKWAENFTFPPKLFWASSPLNLRFSSTLWSGFFKSSDWMNEIYSSTKQSVCIIVDLLIWIKSGQFTTVVLQIRRSGYNTIQEDMFTVSFLNKQAQQQQQKNTEKKKKRKTLSEVQVWIWIHDVVPALIFWSK